MQIFLIDRTVPLLRALVRCCIQSALISQHSMWRFTRLGLFSINAAKSCNGHRNFELLRSMCSTEVLLRRPVNRVPRFCAEMSHSPIMVTFFICRLWPMARASSAHSSFDDGPMHPWPSSSSSSSYNHGELAMSMLVRLGSLLAMRCKSEEFIREHSSGVIVTNIFGQSVDNYDRPTLPT